MSKRKIKEMQSLVAKTTANKPRVRAESEVNQGSPEVQVKKLNGNDYLSELRRMRKEKESRGRAQRCVSPIPVTDIESVLGGTRFSHK